jgi:hypothetical protein
LPAEPGRSRQQLRGSYAGAQFATEIWHQPTADTMAALSGTLVSIGPTGSLRAQTGFRAFDAMFVGPEAATLWCGNFEE